MMKLLCKHHTVKIFPNIFVATITKMNVFDTKAKIKQRNRAALCDDSEKYDYLREEMAFRMADRIFDIKRCFNVAVDYGCGRGHIAQHLSTDYVRYLHQCDTAINILKMADQKSEVPSSLVLLQDESFPFKENSLDLVVSSLNLHWVNDLPGVLKQIMKALRPDGCLLGVVFGGETLFQLRSAFYLADNERSGGFGPHIAPFIDSRDLGRLLSNAGYNLLSIDMDEITVHYPSAFELMQDLRGMGNSNCTWSRVGHLSRDVMFAMAAIYDEMYGIAPGSADHQSSGSGEHSRVVPATFQLLHFIGWKPHHSQQRAAQRGSATVSFKDLGKLSENPGS